MHILIDLSILRHPCCGLGQVAQSYGHWIATHPESLKVIGDVTLLVPKPYIGSFGPHVHYLDAHNIYRFLPCLMPKFDVWHSIHQLSPFRPVHNGTNRIVTVHDLNFLYEKKGRKREQYLQRLQKECNRATEVCFISEFAKKDALKHLQFEAKTLPVIYNGVENLTEGPQIPPPGVDAQQPFLLSIGVIKPKKNIHTLIPMMDKLLDMKLVIAGNDSDAYAHSLRAQLPNKGNIIMTGPVDDAQRRWLYARCTALLFPSLAEGFGLPVIEAMQWGKPVFCSLHTSLPEIGGNEAFYFPDFDPDTMARTVRDGLAIFTPQKEQDCKTRAAQFTYDRHMQQYLKLYSQVSNKTK